jgi:hypothetical protein
LKGWGFVWSCSSAINIALAAIAIGHGLLFLPCDGLGIEQDTPDQAVDAASGVNMARFEAVT